MFAFFCIHTGDSILKGRLCRVVDDLVGSFLVTAYTLHEGRLVVFQFDTIERHCIVRCMIGYKEWILSILHISDIVLIFYILHDSDFYLFAIFYDCSHFISSQSVFLIVEYKFSLFLDE